MSGGLKEWLLRHRKAVALACLGSGGLLLRLYLHRLARARRAKRQQQHQLQHDQQQQQQHDQHHQHKPHDKDDADSHHEKKRKEKEIAKVRLSFKKLLSLLVPGLKDAAATRLASLALIMVLQTALNDRLAKLQGSLFKSVFMQNRSVFVQLLVQNILMNTATSALRSTRSYVAKALELLWRNRMMKQLEARYFKAMAYYKLSFVDKRVESPEQIISSDIPKFCDSVSDLTQDILMALFDGTFFTWRLKQQTSLGWAMVTWAYAVVSVVVVRSVSPNFGKLQSAKLRFEELLRTAFSHVSAHAESIAAFGGASREQSIISERFDNAISHVKGIVRTHWWFGMIEDFVAKYCVSTVAMVVILGPFFGGKLRSDRSQTGNAETLARMRYVTSIIIHQLTAIGAFAVCFRKLLKLQGHSDRIGKLFGVLDDINSNIQQSTQTVTQEGQSIAFNGVKVVTPSGHQLVDDLTFEVVPGKNMLITGPNGAGKSSIFRCLGALWNIQKGTITKPNSGNKGLCGEVFYLPQKPYSVIGSLKEQLTYPLTASDAATALSDEKMSELLNLVDLGYLMTNDAKAVNWSDKLSLGETQRLAMARLFFHNPTFAILDECTSGVSAAMEQRLYELCVERKITCITISHRPALIAFHDFKLELDGKGSFSIAPTGRALPSAAAAAAGAAAAAAAGAAAGTTRKQNKPGDAEATSSTHDLVRHIISEKETWKIKNTPVVAPLMSRSPVGAWGRLKRMLALLVPSWTDKDAVKLGLLALVVVARVTLSDRIAHLNGHTVSFLLQDNLSGFKQLVKISLIQCVASSIMAPTLHYLTNSLAVSWRVRLSKHLHNLYFQNSAFYKVNGLYKEVTHADQRITQDLDKMTTELANTFPDIVKPIVDLIWFTHQTQLLLGWKNTGYLYTYMLGGLGFLRLVTPDFGRLVSVKQSLESTFRYVNTRLREHGESIAFFGGDITERDIIHAHYDELVAHEYKMARTNWWYGFVDEFVVKQLPTIVTWILSLVYTLRFSEKHDTYGDHGSALGHDLRFVASAISHIFSAFGEVLQLNKRYADISGFTARVFELEQMLTAIADDVKMNRDSPRITRSDDVEFTNVDVITPDGHCLVHQLSVRVRPHAPLLVTGPNTSGKSSLFRELGELWPLRAGLIKKPGGSISDGNSHIHDVFLVPQRPYNVIGTLADQITYPIVADLNDPVIVDKLQQILAVVDLTHLLDRRHGWTAVDNWADSLSLGEQQRLGMARLFYHVPKFAVLDQCTDAVSVDVEEHLYNHASKLGITIITISQRPALIGHHKQELRLLDGNGSWELAKIE